MVCSSSMNRMTLRELATVFGTGDHQREVESNDLFVPQQFRHVPAGDLLRQTFGNGGLAHAGLTQENGVILRPAAKHLDDSLDLVAAADDGVQLALFGEFGQVTPESAERRRLDVFLVTVFRGHFLFSFRRSKVGIEFFEYFVASAFNIDFQALEDAGRHAFPLAQQPEQDVLGAHIRMIEAFGFLARERQDFLDARRVRNIADHLRLRPAANLLFDLHADSFHVQPHLLEDIHGHPLAKLDETEQQMLGTQIIMIEAVCFLAGQSENLLRTGSKIVHHLRVQGTEVIALDKRIAGPHPQINPGRSPTLSEHALCLHLKTRGIWQPVGLLSPRLQAPITALALTVGVSCCWQVEDGCNPTAKSGAIGRSRRSAAT
jgi:hypothetical protein